MQAHWGWIYDEEAGWQEWGKKLKKVLESEQDSFTFVLPFEKKAGFIFRIGRQEESLKKKV